jgi:geranylgeranyl diphosphate synthase type II
MLDFERYMTERRQEVDALLDQRLPSPSLRPQVIHEAMRYSVFAGGKRIRPILCMAAAEVAAGRYQAALLPGAAIEILHTFTLIHDDLPAMDNDDLRRGQPTCHIRFGEANAILAGDALLTMAFEWLAACEAPSPYRPGELILELSRASGSTGVIGGQVEDLAAEGKTPTPEQLHYIHTHKTGDLIRASVRIGAIAAGARADQLAAITRYGEVVGHAFQITDDILNATSDATTLGKGVGTDAQRGKATYVAVYGLDEARRRSESMAAEAKQALAGLGQSAEPLLALADYAVHRTC